MSKKDFIALADAIRDHNKRPAYAGEAKAMFSADQIATLADFCQSQNPLFKRERWLDYIAGKCGKNGGVAKGGAK